MPHDVRALTADDQAAAWALGSLAFGYHDRTMPPGWTPDSPGRHTWGVFDGDRLVAKAVDREQSHWFGGRLVPACGVAGVAVEPERRGQGLARLVLARLLAAARERGAAVSTLFDTTPYPYRRAGWEEIGTLQRASVATAGLATVRPPAGFTTRPADRGDLPVLRELFRAYARAGCAVMDRSGAAYDPSLDDYLDEYDGVSVALDGDGTVVGYASWDRGNGYDASGRVEVDDLVATSPAAARTLLAMLSGWASVAPTLGIKVVPADPVHLSVALLDAPITYRRPWMLRLVDAAAAVAERGWPAYLRGSVDLDLTDELCGWNAGRRQLTIEHGSARLEPGGAGTVAMTARGLALWYAGAAGPAMLRFSGHLDGGDDRTDALLAAATAGPAPALLDYF